MPSKLQRAIGAVKDQTSISLAKVVSSNNTSSNLEVAVLKATTHDDVPIDQKYVNEVLKLVSSNKFHAASCARAIGKRIGRTRNWIVALKSLMLVLRIFQDGDPYFPREVLHAMKRGAKILNLSSFRDDSNSSPWDFTSFVRTFALYLDERLECFLTGKLQRRYKHYEAKESWANIHRTKSWTSDRRPNEPVREMKPAMLLDKISYWQRLLDRAIATRPTGAAKVSRLVHTSLYAIVEESFELYKDISDGLTLVLDSFFHLQFQNCISAFQACAKAAKQFKELSDFYSLCKSIGVGRSSEYPSVQTISEELIEALQEFLKDQSSFPSNAKPPTKKRFPIPPATPSARSGRQRQRQNSSGGEQSDDVLLSDKKTNSLQAEKTPEMGSRCTSLEDLINATETETGTCPAISIDLETYPATQQDDVFTRSETGSTRSLPVSNSMADLMSLWDWSEPEHDDDREQRDEGMIVVGSSSSSASINWEAVLAETLTSSPPPNVCAQQAAAVVEEKNHTTAAAGGGWDLVLFDAAPQQQNNQNYNPFLQDSIEVSTNTGTASTSSAVSMPTFQAIPMNQMTSSSTTYDPFGEAPFSAGEQQQNLVHQQQLWLANQNKIIAKHMY
ncbi:hypothetical protein ABFS83_08G114800 [Erythranthe nasuta]